MSNTDKNSSEKLTWDYLRQLAICLRLYFSSIASVFLKIYRLFIYSCKILIDNYKIILPVIIVSFLIELFKRVNQSRYSIQKCWSRHFLTQNIN